MENEETLGENVLTILINFRGFINYFMIFLS